MIYSIFPYVNEWWKFEKKYQKDRKKIKEYKVVWWYFFIWSITQIKSNSGKDWAS